MHSFANLDYLYLEITKENLMKLFFADKSTQSDEHKYIQIIQENGIISMQTNIITKRPPERPPPPKLKTATVGPVTKVTEKKSGIDTLFKDMKIRKKFHTLKENTKKLTKNVQNKMTRKTNRSQSVNEVSKVTANELQVRSENRESPSSDVIHRSKQIDQLERCQSLNHKSIPPRITKIVSSIMPIDDIINENESIFTKFAVTPLIKEFFITESADIEIIDFDQIVDSCLNAFIGTCNRQVEDTMNDINDHFSQALDLNSISLSSNQMELYKIYCIPGWKQMRIVEDIRSKEKFIALKNTSYKSWILLNEKKCDIKKRWILFPIISINTLENEIVLCEEDNFLKRLLKMIMLMCFTSITNDENFPKNIDPNTILLISSKCGIIIIFRETLNESDLFSLEFLECNSIDNIPDLLTKSKLDTQQMIANFFQRPEILSILISSTWPLDYLALMLVELVLDYKEYN